MRPNLLLAAVIALGGCATTEPAVVSEARYPVHNEVGEVVGYEEQTAEGVVVRDLQGRAVGTRFEDLRSRGTNSRNRGVTVIIGNIDSRRMLAEAEQGRTTPTR